MGSAILWQNLEQPHHLGRALPTEASSIVLLTKVYSTSRIELRFTLVYTPKLMPLPPPLLLSHRSSRPHSQCYVLSVQIIRWPRRITSVLQRRNPIHQLGITIYRPLQCDFKVTRLARRARAQRLANHDSGFHPFGRSTAQEGGSWCAWDSDS
jgi:hypothetical protein